MLVALLNNMGLLPGAGKHNNVVWPPNIWSSPRIGEYISMYFVTRFLEDVKLTVTAFLNKAYI